MKHLTSLAKMSLVAFWLMAVTTQSYAQSDGGTLAGTGYDLSWSTVDNGGATSASSGGYELGGTIGQPDAGTLAGSNGCTLSGGFWALAPTAHRIFLPVVIRN